MSFFKKPLALTCAAASLAAGVLIAIPSVANAHGYIGDRYDQHSGLVQSRGSHAGNAGKVGNVQYEPQSIEAKKGFTLEDPATGGPADGKLASAGTSLAAALDEQSSTKWAKNHIETGPLTLKWTNTAGHSTTGWEYFMTKQGWDPNDKLDRGDFVKIANIKHDGSNAGPSRTHTINVPADRSGYHVIYAVWTVADTANAFYNVIDVDVKGHNGRVIEDKEKPSVVPDSKIIATSATEAKLTWGAAHDNVRVTGYKVYDYAKKAYVQELGGNARSATLSGLTPGKTYTFGVSALDAAGNIGPLTTNRVTMPEQATTPAAPKHLHDMGVTKTTASLMWSAGDERDGVRYEIFRGAKKVGETTGTTFEDTGLIAGTKYTYTVRAVSADGFESKESNAHTITTKGKSSEKAPAWSARKAYAKGDRVSHQGRIYEAVQASKGHGDPNWINAPSLWKLVR